MSASSLVAAAPVTCLEPCVALALMAEPKPARLNAPACEASAVAGAATDERSVLAAEEQALIRGLLADRADAWREFERRYSRLMLRCITRVTGRFASLGADDVREVYAMLCLSLLANDKHKLRSFEANRGNRLSSWLGLLATHTAYDFLRGMKREPKRSPVTDAEALAYEQPDPFESYAERQRARLVQDLLAGLSDKDQEFIELYYGEGLDPVLIADRMGISVKTVYSKKHKIQSKLESLLSERQLAA
jgi:RNA polymerase sigma-70 factor (ECF subfamily)